MRQEYCKTHFESYLREGPGDTFCFEWIAIHNGEIIYGTTKIVNIRTVDIDIVNIDIIKNRAVPFSY